MLDKLYKGEMYIEVPKFRSNLFWELIWFQAEEKMCLQIGFSSDPIYLLIRAGFNVIECYKVLIYTLTQWDQWNPIKLFDVCQSSITSNAQLFRWTIYNE